ncbi:MAG: Rrf2 family transcriptional regulator, partial [Rhodobacteraceae bacterium]|nr:Rrf2 family transcriptional regulator [Paracoccaceae bacterium]
MIDSIVAADLHRNGPETMISQKAKYALRALVSLAQAPKGAPVFISDIAEQQSI